MSKYMIVGLGGFLGTILRFWLGGWVNRKMGSLFPYGTILINVSGSFLIGLVVAFLSNRAWLSSNWRHLILFGFIGAYTTFSTFAWETFVAARGGQWLIAGLNIFLSVTLGLLAVWLGFFFANH